MAELSNNNLAILIGLAIAVVFTGMFFSLSSINDLEKGMVITGMLSTVTASNATLTAEVPSTATISLPVSTVSLGGLQPGEWNSSENSTIGGATSPLAAWNNSNVTSNITIQNDGSSNVDIEIYATDQAAAGRGNFTGTSGCITANTCVKIRCGNMMNLNTTGGNCTTAKRSYAVLPNAAGTKFVDVLNFSDTNDEAYIFVNVTIPEDEHARSFTQSITIVAAATG